MHLTHHSTSTDRSSVQPCCVKGAAPGEQFRFADPEVGKFLCLGHVGQHLRDLLSLNILREGQGPRDKCQLQGPEVCTGELSMHNHSPSALYEREGLKKLVLQVSGMTVDR